MNCLTNIPGFVFVVVYAACGSGRHMRFLTDMSLIQRQTSFVKTARCYNAGYKSERIIKAAVQVNIATANDLNSETFPFMDNETFSTYSMLF